LDDSDNDSSEEAELEAELKSLAVDFKIDGTSSKINDKGQIFEVWLMFMPYEE
jgi:hypothetical protein